MSALPQKRTRFWKNQTPHTTKLLACTQHPGHRALVADRRASSTVN